MTLKEIYETKKNELSPAQLFIALLAKITCRKETTVRQWLSGIQEPNDLAKKRISTELGIPVEELFPSSAKLHSHFAFISIITITNINYHRKMTAIEPQVALNGRYSIGETCSLLGIHRDTLRSYTDTERIIKCGFRKIGNRLVKYYLGCEILRFWKMHS